MDISEEYQEMCKDLPDELKHEHPEPNDVVVVEDGSIGYIGNWFYGGGVSAVLMNEGCGCCSHFTDPVTWLPRQDQLQDMLGDTLSLQYFDELHDAYQLYGSYAKTHEQLWLAYVMYEKFGKKWNGKEWYHD